MNHSPFSESSFPESFQTSPLQPYFLTEIPSKVKWGNSVLVCKKYSLPQSKHFSTLGKTLLPKMGHCITSISLYMNRQRHEFPLFLEGRSAPSVKKKPEPAGVYSQLRITPGIWWQKCWSCAALCQGSVQAKSAPHRHTQSVSWETSSCFSSGSIWNS